MRFSIAAAAVLALCGSAHADDKACITKAATMLPRVADLVIDKSTVRPVPAALLASSKGDGTPIIVDIQFTAAGQTDTRHYMCLIAATGQALVRRVSE